MENGGAASALPTPLSARVESPTWPLFEALLFPPKKLFRLTPFWPYDEDRLNPPARLLRLKALPKREVVDIAPGEVERTLGDASSVGSFGNGAGRQYSRVRSIHSIGLEVESLIFVLEARRKRANDGQVDVVDRSSCPSSAKGKKISSKSMTSSFTIVNAGWAA
jgi:hypothetical protein